MTDLGLAFFNTNGEMESIPAMVGQLETAFADMTEEQQAAALSTLFGAEAMRHWAILVDQGSESLAANTQMLEESEGAAAEMANTMMDNAQGALIEFKSALEGAGIALSEHLLPSVTSIIESGTDLVRKFSDLDESTQKWIVGLGLTAAAIGPVMMVIGPLVTTLGSIVTALGTASIAIAGAGGLTAAFGGLAAAAGPVGLAVGGVALAVGGLTAAHHLLKDETLKLNDVSTENAEKMLAQADSVETLANRYDELMGASSLTGDQLLRLMDIESELAQTQNPARVAELKDEYAKLAEESGLTEEQIRELIEVNNGIIEQTPEMVTAYNEQGNAVIENTDAVREHIAALREMSIMELENAAIEALENQNILKEANRELSREIAKIEEDQNRTLELRKEYSQEALQDESKRQELIDLVNGKIKEQEKIMNSVHSSEEEAAAAAEERSFWADILNNGLHEQFNVLQDQKSELLEQLGINQEQISKEEETLLLLADQYLAQEGLNTVREGGLDALDQEIEKLQEAKSELIENASEEDHRNGLIQEGVAGYDQQIAELEGIRTKIHESTGMQSEHTAELARSEDAADQLREKISLWERGIKTGTTVQEGLNRRIRDGKGDAEDMNRELEKDIDKNVDVDDNGDIADLDERASRTVTKYVNVRESISSQYNTRRRPGIPSNADGTNNHPGGMMLAGEAGWEFGQKNGNLEVLTAGFYDKPKGYKVHTHAESMRMLSNMAASSQRQALSAMSSLNSNIGSMSLGSNNGFTSIGREIGAGIQLGIAQSSRDVELEAINLADNMMKAMKKELEIYSPSRRGRKEVGQELIRGVIKGLKDEEDNLNKTAVQLMNEAVNKMNEGNSVERIRAIRAADINLLQSEINYLTRAGATEKEIARSKELQLQLAHKQERKQQEYNNRIREQESIVNAIERARRRGELNSSDYNELISQATVALKNLQKEAIDYNNTLATEAQRAIDEAARKAQESLEETKRKAEELQKAYEEALQSASQLFSGFASNDLSLYQDVMSRETSIMQQQHKAREDSHQRATQNHAARMKEQMDAALKSFDAQTQAHRDMVSDQINQINQVRDARLAAIDEEIDAIRGRQQADSRDEQIKQWEEDEKALQRRLEIAEFAGNEQDVEAVKREMEKFEADKAKIRQQWADQDKIDRLNEQKERIKDEADEKVQTIKDQEEAYLEQRNLQRIHLEEKRKADIDAYEADRAMWHRAMQSRHEEEQEAHRREIEMQQMKFKQLQEQLAKAVEQGKMTQEQANATWLQAIRDLGNAELNQHLRNHEEILNELDEYTDEYLKIGVNMGDEVVDGLLGQLERRLGEVRAMAAKVAAAARSAQSAQAEVGSASVASMSEDIQPMGVMYRTQNVDLDNAPGIAGIGAVSIPQIDDSLTKAIENLSKQQTQSVPSGDIIVPVNIDGDQVYYTVIDRFTGEVKTAHKKGVK